MKVALLLFWSAATWTTLSAFVPRAPSTKPPSTVLYISSWGTKGPPSRWATDAAENPAENVQAYLPEPQAVEARANIDGTCLVSGLVNSKERTDQFLFDLLNHEESAFEFKKILAFCDDTKFAKKRLLSRSARYTGLLDKLDFVQATSAGALPSAEQLQAVKSWIAYLEPKSAQDMLENVQQIAQLVQTSDVENIAILVAGANDMDARQQAVQALQQTQKNYTLVAVGTLEDHPEGRTAYQFRDFDTEEGKIPTQAVFSREEAYRMITELLQLEAGVNKALSFAEVYNQNKTEARLIKGLRSAGYARPQEIDHMVRGGVENYRKAVQEWNEKHPDAAKGYTTTDAWWEREEFQKSVRRSKEREKEREERLKTEREKEVEKIAMEWAKREYFRQSMAGTIGDQTEDDFVKSVWDRALFEGDLKYRQKNGETPDEEAELADFKARQERKQQTMLKRAKDELTQLLDDEGLDGDEIRRRLERYEEGNFDDDEDAKK